MPGDVRGLEAWGGWFCYLPGMVKGRVISPVFALCLLLGLNLLNYADRSVLSALEAKIAPDILAPGDPFAKAKMGALMFAYLLVPNPTAGRWQIAALAGGVLAVGLGLWAWGGAGRARSYPSSRKVPPAE